MRAFGWLDFPTDTHFNARGRLGRLIPILVDLKKDFSFGVDENTTLFYDRGIGHVIGWNGVTFVDLSKSIVLPGSSFRIQNVTGHYLTEGDKFDFSTRTVISSKTLISSPAYSNPTDSSNILSAYEATLLSTRIVDQKAVYNLGKTRTPSAFPKTTPIFEIKFYRNNQTKGYYSSQSKKYTAVNLVYDISFGSNSENDNLQTVSD